MSKTIKPQLLGFGLYLQMSGSDSLHFQIFGSVASQLEDLSGEIFQDSRAVDSSSGSNPVSIAVSNIGNFVIWLSYLPLAKLRLLRCLWILPTGNWSPALADLDTAFCFDFPESFPAFPPAMIPSYILTWLWGNFTINLVCRCCW